MLPLLRRFASAVVFLALSSFATSALADDQKRPTQDYGHPAEGTDAGDVVAWPFRVILFPAWLVSEYLLRRPIGWLIVQTEKHNIVATVQDFFTFGSHDQVTVEMIVANLMQNAANAQRVIAAAIDRLPFERTCECASALKYAIITRPEAIPADIKRELAPLVGKYLS